MYIFPLASRFHFSSKKFRFFATLFEISKCVSQNNSNNKHALHLVSCGSWPTSHYWHCIHLLAGRSKRLSDQSKGNVCSAHQVHQP